MKTRSRALSRGPSARTNVELIVSRPLSHRQLSPRTTVKALCGICISNTRRSPKTKLVRGVRGAIFDVIVYLRLESSPSREQNGVELRAENGFALYVPERCGAAEHVMRETIEAYRQVRPYSAFNARCEPTQSGDPQSSARVRRALERHTRAGLRNREE